MNDLKTVLVTGSHGFIGRHVVCYLAQSGFAVKAASRVAPLFAHSNVTVLTIGDLTEPFDWDPLLSRCDAVVHLAGIAHTNANVELYDRVNRRATEALASTAASRGVHMIYVSTIAAQFGSSANHELTETDPANPDTAYGRSKLAAEQAVRAAGPCYTILRPVAVYGDGAKGNFATLNFLARLPIPLPLGALTAKRSILSVDNLASAIGFVLVDPRARGQTFIVSDPTPLTIPEIISRLRRSWGRSDGLIRMPEKWIEIFLQTVGKSAIWQGLGRPHVARPGKLLALGWNPVEPRFTPPK